MKFVDVSRRAPNRIKCLAVGDPGSGKTTYLASWPRPLILGPAAESSWTTIQYLPEDHFYEEGRRPYVIAIEKPGDMHTVFQALQQQAKGEKVTAVEGWPIPRGRWEIGTIGIDTFTEYAFMYLSRLENDAGADLRKERMAIYGDLQSHLRMIQVKYHDMLPYHVVWTGHAGGKSDAGRRGLLLPGRYAGQAPAKMDAWLYLERREGKKSESFFAHSEPYDENEARHRYGDLLAPKFEPHYEVLEDQLGMKPWRELFAEASGKKSTSGSAKKSGKAA